MLRNNFFYAVLFGLTAVTAHAQTDTPADFVPEVSTVVTVSDLPDLSYNTLGTIPATSDDLWRTSEPDTLLNALTELGKVTLTPELKKTANFLLRADTTIGGINDPENRFGTDGFLAARAQTALDLGLFDTAVQLVDLVPTDHQSNTLRQIKVNAALLSGDTQTACGLVDKYDMGMFGDKTRISCFLANEEKNKAVLAFALYSENPDDDTLFQTLGNAVLNELPTDLPDDFVLKPHHVYLMSLYPGAPVDILKKQTAGIRFGLSDLPTTPVETRITLGETIALTDEQMARLYKLPLFNLPVSVGALNHADLYQKIKGKVNPRTRALLMTQLFEALRETPDAVLSHPLQSLLVSDIPATAEDKPVAFYAAALAALAGNESGADDWLNILSHSDDALDQFNATRLRPLFAAAFDDDLPNERETGLFNDACNQLKSEACIRFWAHMPTEEQAQKPDFIGTAPTTDTTTIQALFDADKIGEGLIQVLIALSHSPHYDAPLIRFLTNGSTGWNGARVRLERMVYF